MLRTARELKAAAEREHEDALAAAARFANRCAETLTASAVYLFGSRAREDWHAGSDCDLLVVSEQFAGERVDRRCARLALLWDGPRAVGVAAWGLTPQEFALARGAGGLVSMAFSDGVKRLL